MVVGSSPVAGTINICELSSNNPWDVKNKNFVFDFPENRFLNNHQILYHLIFNKTLESPKKLKTKKTDLCFSDAFRMTIIQMIQQQFG